ncbi:MAG: SDR family NAD(P)-dependent oxidoreductase [Hyphomicrobiaceae bacterium]
MKLGKDIAAVVTGAASGLGAASARALAEAGCRVAVLDLNAELGGEVAREIGGVFCGCDVTSEQSVMEALGTARAAHGQERILVNCAGIATGQKTARRERDSGRIVPHDVKLFAKVIQVNLVGTFTMIAHSAACMMTLDPIDKDGTRGVITTTASVAAEDGQIGQAAYSASKGGVQAMTLPIARDLSRDGIRICTILPGLFDTAMFATVPDDARRSLEAQVPFPSRLGRPEEYARLVRHICENDMLNGTAIRLDGAIRLAPR